VIANGNCVVGLCLGDFFTQKFFGHRSDVSILRTLFSISNGIIMFINRKEYQIYLSWLAVAQEFCVTDEETLLMLAQWVVNAQHETLDPKIKHFCG